MTEITNEQNENNASILRRIRQNLLGINIYSDDRTLSITGQLMATRLNLLCLFCSILILIMIRGFTPQTNTVLVTSPTLSEFDELSNKYSLTLSCSCSQINIPYNSFLSFTPEYHQICSSDFISEAWISSLFNQNKTNYYPLDFRLSASSQFQIIALLCRIANQSVSDALFEFSMQKMISAKVISRNTFQSEVESLIENFKETIIANVLRMDEYLELNIAYNDLVSSLRSNYYVETSSGIAYGVKVAYYLSKNYTNMSDYQDYSSCYDQYDSTFYSGFYPNKTLNDSYFYSPSPPPIYTVPGILAGCLPRLSIMQSTLECFFDSSCLNTIQSLAIGTSLYHPLNASISSRFPINTIIRSMFNEVFIEDWHNTSNFTTYFRTCAPVSCLYSYTVQFSIIYIITSILGLLGGLTMASKILASLLVKYIVPRLCHICCHQIRVEEEEEEATANDRNLRQTIVHYLRKARNYLSTLNVFDKSILLSDMNQQLWVTRLYLLLLVIGTIILIVYSSTASHLQSITIENPSRNQFEDLYQQYSLTLSCPCTQLSIPFSKIMSIQPRFHQICSSDFIRDDKWLSYFDLIPISNNLTTTSIYFLDFRLNAGRSLFRIMKALCEFANETVTNALNVFNDTEFVSYNPLTTENFNQTTSSLINRFEEQTLGSFFSLYSLIRTTIEDNQLETSTHINIQYISYPGNNTLYIRFKPRPFPNTTFTCLTSNQPVRPQGFYWFVYTPAAAGLNQSIPGLVSSCLPIDSLLLSTLECFYNQSCIQMLFNHRLFWLEDIYKPLSLNVTPLYANLTSQYLPTTKLEDIVSQLLIEEWIVNSDAAVHYEHCQPKFCTYTYTTRFQVIYVITTVIGLFGGLSVILGLIIPLITRIIMQQIDKRRQLRIEPQNQTQDINHSIIIRQPSLLARFKQSINDIRIFHAQINNSIWATRIYFSLLLTATVIVLIFTAISRQAQSHTIRAPSESTFETIYEEHNIDSLSCLCSRSSIEYSTFLSLSVKYHQVCSSGFILSDWWNLIASRGNEPFLLFDQPLLSNHFRMLSSFCTLSQQTVNDSISSLISNTLISIQALPRSSFENQIQSTIHVLIQQTPIKFIHTLEYIINTFRSNQLGHLFLSSWMLEYTTANENYIVATRPLSYNNNTCICATSMSSSCFWPMTFKLFNATNITLPGLVGGCLSVDGLRLSTLECLFDSVCIDTIQLLINSTTTYLIPDALNDSLTTRYPSVTTKVGTLIEELFIEEWMNTTNYSAYYEKCSPRACQYVETEYNTFIYTITLLLGLYGGLTVSIRFLVTYIFKISIAIQHWWHMWH